MNEFIKNYSEDINIEENYKFLFFEGKPVEIFDADVNDYVSIEDKYSDVIDESCEDKEKIDEYNSIMSGYTKEEYSGITVMIDDANLKVTAEGRTKEVEDLEALYGINLKGAMVWIEGAESTSGVITVEGLRNDLFYYIYKNENGKLDLEFLDEYEEGMEAPYYVRDGKYVHMYLNHFSGGSGTQVDPYIINTPQEFQDISLDIAAWYKLGNDIDFNLFPYVQIPNFTGHLDGSGYYLRNLSTIDMTGMFLTSTTLDSKELVKDMGIDNFTFFSSVVGFHGLLFSKTSSRYYENTFKNISIENSTLATTASSTSVVSGLLVGQATSDALASTSVQSFPRSVFANNVTAKDSNVVNNGSVSGGLIGFSNRGMNIYQCGIDNVQVSVTSPFSIPYLGGIIGLIGSAGNSAHASNNIPNSATGTLTGLHECYAKNSQFVIDYSAGTSLNSQNGIGGLIGLMQGSSSGASMGTFNSYTENNDFYYLVDNANIGGIVGRSNETSSKNNEMYNSYGANTFTNDASHTSSIGNIMGRVENSIDLNYVNVDEEVSGITDKYGTESGTANITEVGVVSHEFSADMKEESSYPNYDFVNVWEIDEGSDYPRLQEEPAPPTSVVIGHWEMWTPDGFKFIPVDSILVDDATTAVRTVVAAGVGAFRTTSV